MDAIPVWTLTPFSATIIVGGGLKEEGRKASTDSFMWVMRSAASEKVQAAYFHYSPSRSTEVAKSLLGEYLGYLITDAYAGYNKAGAYRRCLCWAHCRRCFIESIPLDHNGNEIPGSKCAQGRVIHQPSV